jgi:Fic family protein
MKSTGSIKNTVFGKIDETKGEFRKGNVSAGNSYFVNFEKVIPYTRDLVENINAKLNETPDPLDQLELAFSAHFDLVTIHPFYDGNGRTSRLLMNYIQAVNNVPLSIVYKEDRMEYIQALKDARSSKNIKLFIAFMFKQFEKQLSAEITLYKENINASKKPGDKNGFSLFF